MKHPKSNLIIDSAALLVYLIVANPAITGIGIHEWLGLGVFVIFLVHVSTHFDWIIDTLRGTTKSPSLARQGNLVVDGLMLAVFMVVTVSGLGISGAVLPAFGLYSEGYYFWAPLHSISAKVLLALFIVHLVVHWRWIYTAARGEKEQKEKEKNNRDVSEGTDC